MKAVRIEAFGGPEAMRLVELPTPAPGPGEALVRVAAAGVNFIDVYQRQGLYPGPLPRTLGLEGAGVVEAVGDGVGDVSPGTRVAWASVPGSYATHVVAPAARLVPVPTGVELPQAAAAMLQGMTAHYLVHGTWNLKGGESCLVHAAAGGVGLLLCQLARRLGAHVIGRVSTEAKAKLARAAGAREVLLAADAAFSRPVRELTAGRGVDVVYDGVGKDTFEESLASLRPRGLMVLFGAASGPVAAFDPQVLNRKGSLFLTRPKLDDYVATRTELLARAGAVLGAVGRGELSLQVHAALPLAAAARTHELLQGRGTTGKLLLLPD